MLNVSFCSTRVKSAALTGQTASSAPLLHMTNIFQSLQKNNMTISSYWAANTIAQKTVYALLSAGSFKGRTSIFSRLVQLGNNSLLNLNATSKL